MRNSEELMRTLVTVSDQQMETGKQFKFLDAVTNQDCQMNRQKVCPDPGASQRPDQVEASS